MPQQYTAAQQAYLDLLFKRGDGSVPGSWLIPGSVTTLELDPTFVAEHDAAYAQRVDPAEHDAAYDQRVDTWTAPLVFAGNTVSLTQSGIDHGSIGGLTDDDHTQYHNNARGDARYQLLTDLNNLSVYASGSVYTLTATPALLDFGTTDPTLVIDEAGTYLIHGRVRLDSVGATFANETVTLKIRRTNNTAADVANSTCAIDAGVTVTLTETLAVVCLPPVLYTTANSDDNLELWGDISGLPSAGSLTAAEASIVAVRVA